MSVIVDNLGAFLMGPFPKGPVGGLALTIYLGVYTGITSFLLGSFLAALSLTPAAPVRWASRGIVMFVRGVPSLAFLFWMYFLIPRVLGFNLSALQSASIALTIYHGAYIAEDLRGGIRAVSSGQKDAAYASGMSGGQVLLYVTLPQAFRAVAPALVNRLVNLFMYTSIVSLVGVLDFMRIAVLINNRELSYPIQIFLFVGATYFVFCFALSRLGRYFEAKWNWAPKIRTTEAAV